MVAQESDKKCQNMDMINMEKDIFIGDKLVKKEALAKAESRGVEVEISW